MVNEIVSKSRSPRKPEAARRQRVRWPRDAPTEVSIRQLANLLAVARSAGRNDGGADEK